MTPVMRMMRMMALSMVVEERKRKDFEVER